LDVGFNQIDINQVIISIVKIKRTILSREYVFRGWCFNYFLSTIQRWITYEGGQ